MNTNKNNKIH